MSSTPSNPLFARLAARANVQEWIAVERKDYADVKYAPDSNMRLELIEAMLDEGLELGGVWDVFISNYYSRVRLIPIETPQGRQQLGKLIVTLLHALETAVEVHGPMPKPAQPSGEVVEWTRD